jgi:hypothetical protein
MILSRAALMATEAVAAVDKPELVYFSLGCCYAVNRKAAVMVSAPFTGRLQSVPLKDSGMCACSVRAESLRAVVKHMPKDTLFKGLLEYADIKVDGSMGYWTMTDGKRTHTTSCAVDRYDEKLIDELRSTWGNRWVMGTPAPVSAVNLKRLLLLLNAFTLAGCALTGEEPLWIKVSDDGSILFRAQNYQTGQRVIGMTTGYDVDEGKEEVISEWESGVIGGRRPLRKI